VKSRIAPWSRTTTRYSTDCSGGAFGYFTENAEPERGLVTDTSRPRSPVSIAVVGFALTSYPVGVERGWMSRREAIDRTLAALRFFARDAECERGFYYHFLDAKTGRRTWQCEVSLVDTALLVAGVLAARMYFEDEREIGALAEEMIRRIDWRWAQNGGATLSQGWKPECGFLQYDLAGYSEATLLYVLTLGSPAHALQCLGLGNTNNDAHIEASAW